MTEETKTPLAERVEGHWTSDAGYEMATRYATMTRAQLCGGDLTDMEAAYRVAMIMHNNFDHEAGLTIGRDRIRWLSVQLAASQARQRELETERDEANRALDQFHEHKGWTANHVAQRLYDEKVAAEAENVKLREAVATEIAREMAAISFGCSGADAQQVNDYQNRRRDLIRAAALIVAEIERLDRAAPSPTGGER